MTVEHAAVVVVCMWAAWWEKAPGVGPFNRGQFQPRLLSGSSISLCSSQRYQGFQEAHRMQHSLPYLSSFETTAPPMMLSSPQWAGHQGTGRGTGLCWAQAHTWAQRLSHPLPAAWCVIHPRNLSYLASKTDTGLLTLPGPLEVKGQNDSQMPTCVWHIVDSQHTCHRCH